MFYSNDHAPIHVHILKDGHEAKYNVDPVELVFNHGFKKHYILLIESVLEEGGKQWIGFIFLEFGWTDITSMR